MRGGGREGEHTISVILVALVEFLGFVVDGARPSRERRLVSGRGRYWYIVAAEGYTERIAAGRCGEGRQQAEPARS